MAGLKSSRKSAGASPGRPLDTEETLKRLEFCADSELGLARSFLMTRPEVMVTSRARSVMNDAKSPDFILAVVKDCG